MTQPPRMVRVTWLDSRAGTGWLASGDSALRKPLWCQSLGYLLAQDDQRVVLTRALAYSVDKDAPGEDTTPDEGGYEVHPRAVVLKVEYLDVAPPYPGTGQA